MGKRTTEFVLGLIGGIFGFFAAVLGLILGSVGEALGGSGASQMIGTAWVAILFSIVAIVGSVVVRSKPKLGGALLTISAIVGIICAGLFYLLPFVLLIIAGLMGLIRKDKETKK